MTAPTHTAVVPEKRQCAVAVVRAVRHAEAGPDQLLIDVVAVGRTRADDRVIGRTTSIRRAGEHVEHWLRDLAVEDAGDGRDEPGRGGA